MHKSSDPRSLLSGAMMRYYEHNFTDAPYQLSRESLVGTIGRIATHLLSDNSQTETVYDGVTGVSYALLRLVTNPVIHLPLPGNPSLSREHIWGQLLRNVRSAMHAMREVPERRNGWSLFCGHAGVYAISSMVLHEAAKGKIVMQFSLHVLIVEELHTEKAANLTNESQRYLTKFENLSVLASSFSPTSIGFPADEVLYGRAGYLLGILFVQHLTSPRSETVSAIVKALIDSGKHQSQERQHPCPLYYEWPVGEGARPYLGAAHGLMGILYSLLHFKESLESLGELQTIERCLQYVLKQEIGRTGVRGAFGLYRTALNDSNAPLVHWCHGSTGAVFLFSKAYEILGNEMYLQAAIRSGEVVWERGLLKKGPGLCHGVSGNGYALLRLYTLTENEVYLTRASRFGEFMLSEAFQTARVPDRPFSLYEGWAGALCFYIDLLDPHHARFPFFEV